MAGRVREAAGATALAVAITIAIALPVLMAPSDRLFGMPSAGHHHDPFTVMQQMEQPIAARVALQPATDLPGALLARVTGPVAAYNWLVLIAFPLAALAAYLLARHLAIPPIWALAAALAFAFSPFHLAQAAYHPHVAQTFWMPLYLLALWRALDNPTRAAVGLLALAVIGVTLSNVYGAMIAAVITPAAVAGYWMLAARHRARSASRLRVVMISLAAVCAAVLVYAWQVAPIALDTADGDLVRYGARWWSYAVPPIAHPLAGGISRRVWYAAGVDVGMLEQQVSLGWGAIALAAIAVVFWLARDRSQASAAAVPVLSIVAVVAVWFSLAPSWIPAPAVAVHAAFPMFRSFARFGVIVQLMVVLLAAIGAERLWRIGSGEARAVCAALMTLVALEYAVWPPHLSRPVLPTAAHQWAARSAGAARVLDCVKPASETGAIEWLTGGRVSAYRGALGDCTEPSFPEKLAAGGVTHVIVRQESPEGHWLAARRLPDGLRRVVRFSDSDVYEVVALPPAVHTVSMAGFDAREHDATWTWRWMGRDASWWIANNTAAPLDAVLDVEIMAFRAGQGLTVLLDGQPVQHVRIPDEKVVHRIGPLALTPGGHELVFRPDTVTQAALPPANGDTRMLSFRVGGWRWLESRGAPR